MLFARLARGQGEAVAGERPVPVCRAHRHRPFVQARAAPHGPKSWPPIEEETMFTVGRVATGIAVIVLGLACAGGASAISPAGGLASHARGANTRAANPAGVLVPPVGDVYTGVSCAPALGFGAQVGKHPAVFGEFVTWGQSIHFAFNQAAAAHATLMLHISTAQGSGGSGVITPQAIARGDGDEYLVTLSRLIASYGRPIFIRLFPEMNNANNPYSAYNLDGSSRGPEFSQAEFIAAWRRVVTVLRGGAVAAIDTQLAALGQPRLHGVARAGSLPQSQISFVWTPETAGTPAIAGNDPRNYYPGNQYVDWVGTDFYSRFPNFTGLDAFYKEFPQKPFAFGEWAIWGGDNPVFVKQLFAWVDQHRRVQMMLYNQGFGSDSPFALSADPASTQAIRADLAPARFLAYTPTWQ